MRTRRRTSIEDLRLAIDCLPRTSRLAMLEGIDSNRIIAGAYSSGGGICPMLAAHRAGGRTNLISFANAWDRFVFGGARVRKPRPATAREVLVLKSHLEASLLAEEAPDTELAAAIASHEELVARRRQAPERPGDPERTGDPDRPRAHERPGDPDRSAELQAEPGWAWMRAFRSYDEYRAALVRAHALGAADGPARARGERRATRPLEPAG
jgi:hypothetical protein